MCTEKKMLSYQTSAEFFYICIKTPTLLPSSIPLFQRPFGHVCQAFWRTFQVQSAQNRTDYLPYQTCSFSCIPGFSRWLHPHQSLPGLRTSSHVTPPSLAHTSHQPESSDPISDTCLGVFPLLHESTTGPQR